MAADQAGFSDDAILGGRLVVRQSRRGHRVGHDAMLLAAATAAQGGEHAVDLGAGIGAAGLALARRIAGVAVTLVEIDPGLADLARHNAERNELSQRVRVVCLDVGAAASAFASAGLTPGAAACVLMNPPFNALQNPSADRGRRLAHAGTADTLRQWVDAAARLLRPQGALTVIWRADGLDAVLATLATDFGGLAVLPVYPKPEMPAVRVLVRAIKGSHAPLALLPGFLLASADGEPTAAAESVLRDGAALFLG
jgi:tRNA1(Val) A37 N6-methylase TrmN6